MHHHTTFHPYIQATVFLIAGIAHFFKFVFLLAVTTTVLYCDGEIFLANAQVEADATTRMENDQSANSPNGIARKCFHKRQRAIKWLRKVLGIYPALQLLCGIITLIFWWKGGATMKGGAGGGEEGAGSSSLVSGTIDHKSGGKMRNIIWLESELLVWSSRTMET